MALDFIVGEPFHLHQLSNLLWSSNCHVYKDLALKIRHQKQKQKQKATHVMIKVLPWEPPSCCRALTKRRCNSGDQHLLALRTDGLSIEPWVPSPATFGSTSFSCCSTLSRGLALPALGKGLVVSANGMEFLSWSFRVRVRSVGSRLPGRGVGWITCLSLEKGVNAPPDLVLEWKKGLEEVLKACSWNR